MKKTTLKTLCIIIIAALLIGGVSLAVINAAQDNNRIETAVLTGEIIIQTDDVARIQPSVPVEYVVSVRNTGTVPMLGRVRIDTLWRDNFDNSLSADNIKINYESDYWLYLDGYFYYTALIEPQEESSPLSRSFEMIAANSNQYRNRQLDLSVQLECIQAAGNAISYLWGLNHSDLGITPPEIPIFAAVTVTYVSQSAQFTVSSNFFEAFRNMVPGETRMQEMRIANSASTSAEIYIRATLQDSNDALARTLMEQYSKIIIRSRNGDIIFNGSVLGAPSSLSEPFSLGVFAKGQTQTFTVEITIHPEAGDEFQNVVGQVAWTFSASETADPPRPPQQQQPPRIPLPPPLNREVHFAYMLGFPDGTFRPTANMTRAEVTVMFSRLMTETIDENEVYTNSFSDVTPIAWYYNQIGFMERFGIINGYQDGTFRADQPITRAEFAVIASRFERMTDGSTIDFSDVPSDHWANRYIAFVAGSGWMEGYPNSTFRPDNNIIRAEVVTVVNRMLNRSADVNFVNARRSELTQFIDLDDSYWAFYEIMEAANGHDFQERANAAAPEVWTKLN
ncbi:MAG: S-layer homology domain-containing protein [Oscillospiraceae bacterium]|nr:S-layer homology domain-containing protein [Oscillospiraceae bacterium]